MNNSNIKCPNCGHTFELSAAFREQLEEEKKEAIQQAIDHATQKAESEKKKLQEEFESELNETSKKVADQTRRELDDEYQLRLGQKDLELERIRTQLKELEKRTQQGSVELQGEALEAHLKASLQSACPRDTIRDVKKGEGGADLIHEVIDSLGKNCGSIVWEAKNTKRWNDDWISKVKDDASRAGSVIRVIVSVTLPDNIRNFDLRDGVWVCSVESAPALARVLSQHVVQLNSLSRALAGREGKLERVYSYLISSTFRDRMDLMTATWRGLQDQINKEEAAMKKQWADRRKQLDAVLNVTVDLYSDISSIIGQEMPEVEAFTLDALPERGSSTDD